MCCAVAGSLALAIAIVWFAVVAVVAWGVSMNWSADNNIDTRISKHIQRHVRTNICKLYARSPILNPLAQLEY